ncbi:hypothetical protein [Azospirillum sp. TSO22-1]|nr:hypothetical protein [Azospirillum sp. TSO22-1]
MITAIVRQRCGTDPEIGHFETFAVTDNPGGAVTVPAAGPA